MGSPITFIRRPSIFLPPAPGSDRRCILTGRPAIQTRSVLHRDAADGMKIEMFLNFGNQLSSVVELDHQCVVD